MAFISYYFMVADNLEGSFKDVGTWSPILTPADFGKDRAGCRGGQSRALPRDLGVSGNRGFDPDF